MSNILKLQKIGNSVGIILPHEVLVRLHAAEGEFVTLTESPDGYRLEASDPETGKTMTTFETLSQRYRSTLRKLAE